jgi:hypothetical protein
MTNTKNKLINLFETFKTYAQDQNMSLNCSIMYMMIMFMT